MARPEPTPAATTPLLSASDRRTLNGLAFEGLRARVASLKAEDESKKSEPPPTMPDLVKKLRQTLTDPDVSQEDKALARKVLQALGESTDEENAKAIARVFDWHAGRGNAQHLARQRAALRFPGGR